MRSLKLPIILLVALAAMETGALPEDFQPIDLVDPAAARTLIIPAPQFDFSVLDQSRHLAVLDLNHDGVDDLAVLRLVAGLDAEGKAVQEADLTLLLGNPAAVYPNYPKLAKNFDPKQPFLRTLGPLPLPRSSRRLAAVDASFDSRKDLLVVDAESRPVSWLASRELGDIAEVESASFELRPYVATHLASVLNLEAKVSLALEKDSRLQSIRLGPHSGGDAVAIHEDGSIQFIPRALGTTFTVNSIDNLSDSFDGDGICDTANDPTTAPPTPPSGDCTLRAAIEQANVDPGSDTIEFDIGLGGQQTILVNGPLPAISAPVTIDGTTQDGFTQQPLIRLEFDGGGIIPAGLTIDAPFSLVRGLSIGGFQLGNGIAIFQESVAVETCYLGTTADGDAGFGNLRGLASTADRSQIGGLAEGVGNLISGNTVLGAFLTGNLSRFEGNLVGTDSTGTIAIPNGGPGLEVDGNDVWIEDNLVSGNVSIGIRIDGDRPLIFRNKVGTNLNGMSPLGNDFAGIYLNGVDGGQIGEVFAGNLISGNDGDGIRLAGVTGVKIFSNLIGADVGGAQGLGNRESGIHLESADGVPTSDIAIGGPGAFPLRLGNFIVDNGDGLFGSGIFVGDGSSQVEIEGNFVGLGTNLLTLLGNGGGGIWIRNSSDIRVGRLTPGNGTPNIIVGNEIGGIIIADTDADAAGQDTHGNEITENVIFRNNGLGINLVIPVFDGVTQNDDGDADFGPNDLQNFPTFTNAFATAGGAIRLVGTLESLPSTSFDIRIFDSPFCHISGHGEGRRFVGEVRVTTNASGDADFTFDSPVAVNIVAATATQVATKNTSEFSQCYLAGGGDGTGRLGNFIWQDENNDGLQGFNEAGVEDVVVELRNSAGTSVLESTVTDSGGFYGFDGLASGTYRIRVVPPAGLSPTLADQGLEDTDDSDIQADFQSDPFSYTAGSVDLSVDAGLTSKIFMDGFESGNTANWASTLP